MFPTRLHIDDFIDDEQRPFEIDRWQCGRKNQRPHFVDQISFHFIGADNECSYRGGRFSERADQEIYLFNNVLFFGASQSALTSHAESMGFVDIQVNIGVVFFQRHQAGQVAFVTVHAEYAFGHDEYLFVLRGRLGNQTFQLFVIVMPVAYAAGFGESYPVDYARMDEFVGQN